jgi:signal peptidase I
VKESNETGYIIKRVYKLPGESVDWYNVPKNWSLTKGEYVVPEGKYYILGDNREVSEDSRVFGPIDAKRIIGKVVVR